MSVIGLKKGDMIIYKSRYKKNLFRKIEITKHIRTYKNQGEIDVEYQLKNNDILEVLDCFMTQAKFLPMSTNIPNLIFHGTYFLNENFNIISNKNEIIKIKKQILSERRLEKLKKLNEK